MTRKEAYKKLCKLPVGHTMDYITLTPAKNLINEIFDQQDKLEAKYNQLTHKHDLVCHDNCQNLCWENEESYCKEEGCIRNYINPSLYIGVYEDKYKPR